MTTVKYHIVPDDKDAILYCIKTHHDSGSGDDHMAGVRLGYALARCVEAGKPSLKTAIMEALTAKPYWEACTHVTKSLDITLPTDDKKARRDESVKNTVLVKCRDGVVLQVPKSDAIKLKYFQKRVVVGNSTSESIYVNAQSSYLNVVFDYLSGIRDLSSSTPEALMLYHLLSSDNT